MSGEISSALSRIERHISSKEDDDTVHLVIGHRQIRDCETCFYEEEDLNFPIDWLCKPNGQPEDFIKILEHEMKHEKRPLKISAISGKIVSPISPLIVSDILS